LDACLIHKLKSRPSTGVACSQRTSTAARNRHQRSKSIAYDRNVSGAREAASNSRKNDAAGAATAPSASITWYGSSGSSVAATRPIRGTASVATFRSCDCMHMGMTLAAKSNNAFELL
jgi:hypothetical protein